MKLWKKWVRILCVYRFWDLLFPILCVHCKDLLRKEDRGLCTNCWSGLRRTYFERQKDNPIARQLKQMINIEDAFTLFYFEQHSPLQSLIHVMKYEGRKEIAYFLGQQIGYALQEMDFLPHILVPIPLHPRKLKKRGYNQSGYIAQGIAEVLGWQVEEKILFRIKNTHVQALTTNREERIENLSDAFDIDVDRATHYKKAKVFLVDDVITTGTTIREASQVLLTNFPLMQLSIGSVAGVVNWEEAPNFRRT